ncbi:MAG: hypothetical protein GY944_27905 [bacterium]|nr:hypothetical protein [bacterium]
MATTSNSPPLWLQRVASCRSIAHRRTWWFVVVGLFVVYNLNFREIGGTDTIPATLLPAAIVAEQSLTLDRFRPMFQEDEPLRRFSIFGGAVQPVDGHLRSSYPVGGAILATPVYAPAVWLGMLKDWRDHRVAAKVAASLMVAFSAGFLFLGLKRLAPPGAALALTLAYALGTSAWSIASQGLWQHGPGMFLLSLGLLLLLKLEESPSWRAAAGAGACLAMAVVCRPLNLIPALTLSLFVLIRHRRQLLAFALPFGSIGLWLVWYNVSVFGRLTGGYEAIYRSPALRFLGLTPESAFSLPLLEGLASTLMSPSKGMLIFSPFMLAGLFGIGSALRDREFALSRYLAVWFLLVLVVLSMNQLWWGGATYGPRYFSELMLPLTFMIALCIRRIATRPVLLGAFGVAVVASIAVQVLGAFYYPCGWDARPKWVHQHTERLWDWSDPTIVRCIQAGRERGTQAFEFLRAPHPPDEDGMR